MTTQKLDHISKNKNLGTNYSKIIPPEDYNMIMTEQHLYIKAADHYITKEITKHIKNKEKPNILEIGCGPARITKQIFNANHNAIVYGLDVDSVFLDYAQQICKNLPIHFINSSIEKYQHPCKIDLFYSEGFHHHVSKGNRLNSYLKNIFTQLIPGGHYIVGDEFIAEYTTDAEREINLTLWYGHIIASAAKSGFDFLAQEEAKTFLDDINEGRVNSNIKNSEQIHLVLHVSKIINDFLQQNLLDLAREKAQNFLNTLNNLHNNIANQNDAMDISRGDFKISCSDFEKEVEEVGFIVDNFKAFGPASNVGCMGVYTLRKP